jgi:alkaline phosphatase/alkaline phosphatase D
VLILIFFSQCHTIVQPDEYYCTIFSGEPTQTSVTLLARLHKSDTLIKSDIQGIDGFIKFRITRDQDAKSYMESPFFHAGEGNDFLAKYEFTGLRPGQKYFYSISYGRDTSNNTLSPWSSFKTLNSPESERNISFVVAGGLDYLTLKTEFDTKNRINSGSSIIKPVFPAIFYYKPDFLIINGVKNNPGNSGNTSYNGLKELRMPWHALFCQPEFSTVLSITPVFWMLPDNSDAGKVYGDEVPVPSKFIDKQSPRTYRLNRDVQMWMPGNLLSAGNSLTVSAGINDLDWLKNSLKESNAPFKLIISTSSILLPDDTAKSVTLLSSGGFSAQRDSLLNWLSINGFRNNGLFFICTDSDLQYHRIDPSGFEEFSCGTLFRVKNGAENSAIDTLMASSEGSFSQRLFSNKSGGGFILLNSDRDEYNSPVLLFRFFDDQKKLLYAVNKY